MSIWNPVLNVIVLLALAMVLGSIAERLKQSAIVGFMLAGLLLGPNVAGMLLSGGDGGAGPIDQAQILAIADLGVTLLMFTIGLEFSWSRLRRLGATALAAGAMQIGLTMTVGAGVCLLFGFDPKAAVAVGSIVALSSTGVVMPALARRAEVDSVHGRFALGILLVQDVAVIPLVLVVAALGGQGTIGQVLGSTAMSFGIVAGFVTFFVLFTKFALPAIVAFNAPTGNRDVSTLFAIVLSLGAAWSAQYFGLSPALGAFIAAIFLGESVIAPRLRGDVGPFKTVFVTLFFSSIGMLAEPVWMFQNWWKVGLAVFLLVLLKPTVIWVVGVTFRLAHRHAIAAGVCMGQVGVFSFVLARSALDGEVIDLDQFSLIVSITFLTLFATPYLVGSATSVGAWGEAMLRKVGLGKSIYTGEGAMSRELSGHVVVIGYGPAGRAVAASIAKTGTVVVIDLNPRSIATAREAGLRAYVGDAGSPQMLETASIKTAEALVVTLPDHRLTMAVIIEARELSPKLRIIARSRYHRYVDLLSTTGADVVVDEEATVGDTLAETIRLHAFTDSEADHAVVKEDPKAEAEVSAKA